jgi:simple sugar transport system permease protein
MEGLAKVIFSADFLFTTIRVMTPVLFAAMACMVFGKGGIDAIATEGIMLICALAGVVGSFVFHSAWMGVLVASVTGALLAMLFGYITLTLKSDQVLAGIAINTFASGVTIFIVFYLTGEKGSTQSLATLGVPNVDLPLIKAIPFAGQVLSGHNALSYLALVLLVALGVFFYRTPIGLRIRAVGENPNAAASVGISVFRCKYIALIMAGALAGMGGAFMSMGYVSFFSREMVAGRGFIGMAAESMGRGTPIGVLLSSMLFGAADSMAIRFQMLNLPPYLIQTIPYLVTIVAIAIYSYARGKEKRAKVTRIEPEPLKR